MLFFLLHLLLMCEVPPCSFDLHDPYIVYLPGLHEVFMKSLSCSCPLCFLEHGNTWLPACPTQEYPGISESAQAHFLDITALLYAG